MWQRWIALPRGDHIGGGEEVTGSPLSVDSLTCEFANLGDKTSCRSRELGRTSAPNLLPRNANSAGAAGAVTHPDVSPTAKLAGLIAVGPDERVFRVGDDSEIDIEATAEDLFGDNPGHVLVHHCRKVSVVVSYVGAERTVEVHPSAHVKKVRKEAIDAFGLDKEASADLVLRLPGSSDDLPVNSPIGAFVAKGSCTLQVDLVHLVRPQG